MDADPRPGPLCHPLAGPIVSRFLAGPAGGLIARLGPDGTILDAAGFRSTPPPASLDEAMTAPSARRWHALLQRGLDPGGRPRGLVLRFREDRRARRLCCLVHREADGALWLLGVPAEDPRPEGAAVGDLARELAALKRHLDRADRMTRLVEKARREASTDPLTGLPNRRQGARWFRDEVARHHASGAPFCCVVLDIDDFKAINDRFGHPVGDRVLQVAARCLGGAIRPDDRIFRFGGEEFVVLLPGTDLDGGRALAERLRATLAAREIRALGAPIRASFGVALLGPGESPDALFRRADHALARAKQAGRNRVEVDP